MDGYKLQQNNNICDSNTHGVEGSGDSKIQLLNLYNQKTQNGLGSNNLGERESFSAASICTLWACLSLWSERERGGN